MPPTAYGRMKERERKKKPTKRGNARSAEIHGKCGAKKRKGGKCGQAKGYGTTHPGIGCCKYHGGNMATHNMHAARQRAIMMGAEKEINPLDALIWCIKITAGEVEFCSRMMEDLEQEEWLEYTMVGKQLHVWAKERQKAVDRLAKFSKDALALGIAERAVRMAEQYGSTIAKLLKGVLGELQLTNEQQKIAPIIVRKHLALLESSAPVSDEDRRHLPEIPARVA